MRRLLLSLSSFVLAVSGCAADPQAQQAQPGEWSAATQTNTPASSITYLYSAASAPAGGLTATNVQDGLNQCAAVGYNALTTANAYTDQRISAVTNAFTAADAVVLASANAYTDQQVAAEAAARQAADSAEAAARQAADSAEARARAQGDSITLASANGYTGLQVSGEAALRLAADGAEAAARQQGDHDTLASANAYTDLAVGSQGGADQAPFGYGTTLIDCACTNGICVGFCASSTDGTPIKHSSQIVDVTTVSFFDADPVIVELCNSVTNACFDIHVPPNTPVNQEFKHPLAVDSMIIFCGTTTSACSHPITYSVLGTPANQSGAKAADQTPFGVGLTMTDCSCTNNVCTGFCTSISDLARHSPQMLNLTAFTLSDADGLLVDFCNSLTSACFRVSVPPGVTVSQQLERALRVDSMSVLCPGNGGTCGANPLSYAVIGYY